jgi:hypothetical protein
VKAVALLAPMIGRSDNAAAGGVLGIIGAPDCAASPPRRDAALPARDLRLGLSQIDAAD